MPSFIGKTSALLCALAVHMAGAQTIARIDQHDSLIVNKDLEEIVIDGNQLTGQDSRTRHSFTENVEELMEGSLGISLVRRGNYASEITMRGLSSERINSTIDGMKIFSACTDKMDPVNSYVAANNMKEVHCKKSGESSSFGSNTGGQVNFQLKEAVLNDHPKVRANFGIGANSVSQGIQSSINANYSEKNWGIRINGMRADHENYRAGGGQVVENSQFSKTNLGMSLKAKLSGSDFLLIDLIADEARDVGYPALPMDVAYARAGIYSLTYKKYLSKGIVSTIKWKLYGNNIEHLMDDSQRDVYMHMDMPGWSDTYGTYLMMTTKALAGHSLSFNIDAYSNNSLAEMTMYPEFGKEMFMLTWPDIHRNSIGVYLSDSYALTKKSKLTWTGRMEWAETRIENDLGVKQLEVFSIFIDEPLGARAISSSLSFSHSVTLKHELTMAMSYSERLPTVSEQFAYYIFNSQDAYDYLGDPYLKNEKALKVELNHNYKASKVLIKTSIYGMHMPNYVLGIVDPELDGMTWMSNGVKVYQNLPFADLVGFETGLESKLNEWTRFTTSFSLTLGRDNELKPLPLIPPLKNRSSLIVKFGKNEMTTEFIAAALQNNYRPDVGESRTPGYALVNLHYRRVIGFGEQSIHLFAGLDNVLDTYYYDHLDWNSIPRPGRNIFLKLQFNLN